MAKNKGNQPAADAGTDDADTDMVEPGADVRAAEPETKLAELEAENANLRDENGRLAALLAEADAEIDRLKKEAETFRREIETKAGAEIDRLAARVAELEAAPLDPESLPRCERMDGSSLSIVPAYIEAGSFQEANAVTVTDGTRTAVYTPAKVVDAVPAASAAPCHRWHVSVPHSRLPARTVEADSRAAAIAAYKERLGIIELPNAAEAHPAE